MEVDTTGVVQRSAPLPAPSADSCGWNPGVAATADVHVKKKKKQKKKAAKDRATHEEEVKQSQILYPSRVSRGQDTPLRLGLTFPCRAIQPGAGMAEVGADRGSQGHLDIMADGAG